MTQQQSAPPYQGNGNWNGNFAFGDWVLGTQDSLGPTSPITLNFGATAVAAGGAQIQPNLGSPPLPFTAKVEAFDGREIQRSPDCHGLYSRPLLPPQLASGVVFCRLARWQGLNIGRPKAASTPTLSNRCFHRLMVPSEQNRRH